MRPGADPPADGSELSRPGSASALTPPCPFRTETTKWQDDRPRRDVNDQGWPIALRPVWAQGWGKRTKPARSRSRLRPLAQGYSRLGFRLTEYTAKDGTDELWGVWLQRKGNPHDVVFSNGRGPRLHHFAYTVPRLAT